MQVQRLSLPFSSSPMHPIIVCGGKGHTHPQEVATKDGCTHTLPLYPIKGYSAARVLSKEN